MALQDLLANPRAIRPSVALAIVELRRKLFTQSLIATYLGVSKATVSGVLRRADLSGFNDLAPFNKVQRYERDALDDLLHIDIKKLGRFSDVGHRITGNFAKLTRGLGYDYLFVAVDAHARVSFTAMRPDERKDNAESFLREAVAYLARLGA